MKLSAAQRRSLTKRNWKYYPHIQRWVKVSETGIVFLLDRNQFIPVPHWTLLAADIRDFYHEA